MDRGFRETSRSRCFAASPKAPPVPTRVGRQGWGWDSRRGGAATPDTLCARRGGVSAAVTVTVPRNRPLSPRPGRDGVGAGEASLRR